MAEFGWRKRIPYEQPFAATQIFKEHPAPFEAAGDNTSHIYAGTVREQHQRSLGQITAEGKNLV